ncbi:MAG: multicopper oxidase domain-containing protein [Candidatus Bathyarchaeia archaeon]|jgi:FtsP/CotA-like multicopper oxidase with cupredoxin domain
MSRSFQIKKQKDSDPAFLNSGNKPVPSPTTNEARITLSDQGLNRREFLKLTAITAGGGLATLFLSNSLKPLAFVPKVANQLLEQPRQTKIGLMATVAASVSSLLDPMSIPKFENQLVSPPPIYQPNVVTSQGKVIRHDYTVAMASFNQQILPPSMNLLTPVWGYAGPAIDAITGESLGSVQSSPGPTFEATRGVPIQVVWQNNITSPYMFAVDPTIHWANPINIPMSIPPFPTYPPGYPNAQSPVPLVTHLHGGENQSYSDGGPNQWFTSDGKHGQAYYTAEKTGSNAAVYYYPNTQQPTTLWYHDHALGVTRLNVMSGLAGFYLIRESNGSDKVAAMLPTGKYEMPLVIQDRSFNSDGSLSYTSVGSVTDTHPYWVNSFVGNAIMVNGKVWPNMNVDRGQYRLRLLNGSNTRFYSLSFSNAMTFIQIGSDGGYLKAPVPITTLFLAPAERADIIVDFSILAPGEKVTLQNTALISTSASETQTVGQIMQFTANNAQGTVPFNINSAPKPFNPTLAGSNFPTLPKPTKQRVLTLYEIAGSNGLTVEALLDGQTWGASTSETPELGATEDWVIVNPTMDAHPIHIHLVQFQLAQRQSLNAPGSYVDEWLSVNGQPPFNHPTRNVQLLSSFMFTTVNYPTPEEQCWKDTITVNSGEVLTIRVRFAQQDGSGFPFDATAGPGYVWHCHLLEHEDNEMMRPYKLTAPSSAVVPIAVSSAVAGAAILSAAYYYQRRRKKKAAGDKTADHSTQFSSNQKITLREEITDEKDDY